MNSNMSQNFINTINNNNNNNVSNRNVSNSSASNSAASWQSLPNGQALSPQQALQMSNMWQNNSNTFHNGSSGSSNNTSTVNGGNGSTNSSNITQRFTQSSAPDQTGQTQQSQGFASIQQQPGNIMQANLNSNGQFASGPDVASTTQTDAHTSNTGSMNDSSFPWWIAQQGGSMANVQFQPQMMQNQMQPQMQPVMQSFPINNGQQQYFVPWTGNAQQTQYISTPTHYFQPPPQSLQDAYANANSDPRFSHIADPDRNKDRGSKFRGVSWNRRSKLWTSRIWNLNTGKSEQLGSYESELRAALCVDFKAVSYYGEDYADLNFPDADERQRLLVALTKTDIDLQPLLREMRDDPFSTIRKLSKRGQANIKARYLAQRNKASSREVGSSSAHGRSSASPSVPPHSGGSMSSSTSNKRSRHAAFGSSDTSAPDQTSSSRSSTGSSGGKEGSSNGSNGGRNEDGSSFDEADSGDGGASNGTNRSSSASRSASTANSGAVSGSSGSGSGSGSAGEAGSAGESGSAGSGSGSKEGAFRHFSGNGNHGDGSGNNSGDNSSGGQSRSDASASHPQATSSFEGRGRGPGDSDGSSGSDSNQSNKGSHKHRSKSKSKSKSKREKCRGDFAGKKKSSTHNGRSSNSSSSSSSGSGSGSGSGSSGSNGSGGKPKDNAKS